MKRKIDQQELYEIIAKHTLWLKNKNKGKKANFNNIDLSELICSEVDLSYADFQNSVCNGTSFYKCMLYKTDFSISNCNGASFVDATISDSEFASASLKKAYFNSAVLDVVTFRGSNLEEADFDSASFRYVNLKSAYLKNIKLSNEFSSYCTEHAPIYQCSGGFGSKNRTLTVLALGERKDWKWFAGCFSGTESELLGRIKSEHGAGTFEALSYFRAMSYLTSIATLSIKKSDLFK